MAPQCSQRVRGSSVRRVRRYILVILACCAAACEAKGGANDAADSPQDAGTLELAVNDADGANAAVDVYADAVALDVDGSAAGCAAKSTTCLKYFLSFGTCEPQAQNADKPCGQANDPSGCGGYSCESGSCVAHPGQTDGAGCGSGGVCQNGVCSVTICGAKDEGIQCKSESIDYACVALTKCAAGQCMVKEVKVDGVKCSLPTSECMQPPGCKKGVCTASNQPVPNGVPCAVGETITCNSPGTCIDGKCITDSALPNGTICGKPDTKNCSVPACAGGKCTEALPLPDGTTCVFASDECAADSHCSAGTCKASAPQKDGLKCGVGSLCAPKSCKSGNCESTAAADGTPCGENADPCKVNVCTGGTCSAADALDGTACPAPADDPCAQSGQCKSGACIQKTPVADGKLCGEQTNCGEAPLCKAGKCVGKNKADDAPCKPEWPNACAVTTACKQGKCEAKGKKPDGSLCDVFGPKPKECTLSPTCFDGQCTGPVVKVPEGAPCEIDAGGTCSLGYVCKAGDCVSGGGPTADMTGRACNIPKIGPPIDNDLTAMQSGSCIVGFCEGKQCTGFVNSAADGSACATFQCSNLPHSQHCLAGNCKSDTCIVPPGKCYKIVQETCGGCYTSLGDSFEFGWPCIGSDKGPCFTKGSCDGMGGCKQYEISGGPCDDGNPKTQNDHCCGWTEKGCQLGMCVGE